MVIMKRYIATVNVVDESERRDPNETQSLNPGRLEDLDLRHPVGPPNQSQDGAEPTAIDRQREGSDDVEIEAERGFNLVDLTEREDQGGVLNTWTSTPDSYGDHNNEEDPDLHLGFCIDSLSKLGFVRPDKTPGDSAIAAIRVPEELVKDVPPIGEGDSSPHHITVVRVIDIPEERFEELNNIISSVADYFPPIQISFRPGVEYFTNKDDEVIAHKGIDAPGLEDLHKSLKEALEDAGFEVTAYPEFKPHVTLEYGPAGDKNFMYEGEVPEGEWDVQELEIWGTEQDTPKIPLNELAKAAQRQPWICFDLDGTILEDPTSEDYKNTAEGDQPPFGKPFPNADKVLGELIDMGVRASIYTARFSEEDDNERYKHEIEVYLDSVGIPYSDVFYGIKPRCDLFVDNKGIHFAGDWMDTRNTIFDMLELDTDKEGVAVIDTVDSGNSFIDPWGGRRDLAIPRDLWMETENPYG